MNRHGATLVAGSIRPIGVLVGRLIRIAKAPLCLAVAFSALFGFLLARGHLDGQAMTVFVAVFFLACGSATLNSCQDRRFDRLLRRTRERPLASGMLSPPVALLQSVLLLAAGLLLLRCAALSTAALVASLVAVLLYNGIYTPLKYKTTWALIPGAICGALPPYIGWLAAGGRPDGAVILAAATMLAVWQIPHFWLVVLEHQDDYRAVSLPSMIGIMPQRTLRLISVLWVLALVSVLHSLLMLSNLSPWWLGLPISISALVVLVIFAREMCYRSAPRYRQLFYLMNGFILLVMAFLSLGSLK